VFLGATETPKNLKKNCGRSGLLPAKGNAVAVIIRQRHITQEIKGFCVQPNCKRSGFLPAKGNAVMIRRGQITQKIKRY